MSAISELWIYPVKSCGGVRLDRATVELGGLRGDRRFMLVDGQSAFLTARTEPRLLSIGLTLKKAERPSEGYILEAPGQPPLKLPFSLQPECHEARIRARVWRDEVQAIAWGPGSAWFQSYLDRPDVSLLYQPQESLRQIDPRYSQEGELVSFADGYPLLLCNEESLHELNERMTSPVPMTRFRPNVVIRGAEAFAEDRWAELRLGELSFLAPKLCDRCVMTTMDPGRAHPSKEPLRTLAKFRKWGGAVWFGSNLIPQGPGTLRVGDPVDVVHLREHPRNASSS